MRRLVIGLGTGRCGTVSLSRLLNAQPDAQVRHELRPYLPWAVDEALLARKLDILRRLPGSGLVGEVGFFYLPYVIRILAAWPGARILALRRAERETVASFMVKTRGKNHWADHDGSQWRHDADWDPCFPIFETGTKEQALHRYWRSYYAEVERLCVEYPSSVRLFDVEDLNKQQGVRSILDFVGIARRQQVVLPGLRENVLASGPAAELAARLDATDHGADVRCPASVSAAPAAACERHPSPDSKVDRQVTIIIKSFMRPRALRALVRSIRSFYPNITVLAADDGDAPERPPGVDGWFELPYDVGVSAGRNFLLDRVETEFTTISDDDWIFTRRTRIEATLDAFERCGQLDLVAGRSLTAEDGELIPDTYYGIFYFEGENLVQHFGRRRRMLAGFSIYDFVPNVFVARTAALRQVRWDERLKTEDHMEFFWRFKDHHVSTLLDDFIVINSHAPGGAGYAEHRFGRLRHYQELVRRKIGVDRIVQRHTDDVLRKIAPKMGIGP